MAVTGWKWNTTSSEGSARGDCTRWRRSPRSSSSPTSPSTCSACRARSSATPLFHRDGLREVARLVDVGATHERGVVGEKLHGNRVDNGREHAGVARRADHVDALAFGEVAVEIGEHLEL